jgi:hypothetical protein
LQWLGANHSILESYSVQATYSVTGKPVREAILLFLKGPKEIRLIDLDNRKALAKGSEKALASCKEKAEGSK